MSKVTPHDKRFAEMVGGFFYQLLKAGGVSMMPTSAHERLRDVGEQFARSVESAAERTSILVIRKLQTAVKSAFEAMEQALSTNISQTSQNSARLIVLDARITELETALRSLNEVAQDGV